MEDKLKRVEFRYFDCFGRGEHIRYMLYDSGIQFEDVRVEFDQASLADWVQRQKHDVLLSGYFKAIPLLNLHKEDGSVFSLSQTLAIGNFLAEKLGLFATLSAEEKAHDVMIATASYEDIIVVINQLIWAPVRNATADFETLLKNTRQQITGRLESLSSYLGSKEYYVRKDKPSFSDYFAVYAVQKASLIFTPTEFRDKFANLVQHQQRMEARENIARYLHSDHKSKRQTGCPKEEESLLSISSFLSNLN